MQHPSLPCGQCAPTADESGERSAPDTCNIPTIPIPTFRSSNTCPTFDWWAVASTQRIDSYYPLTHVRGSGPLDRNSHTGSGSGPLPSVGLHRKRKWSRFHNRVVFVLFLPFLPCLHEWVVSTSPSPCICSFFFLSRLLFQSAPRCSVGISSHGASRNSFGQTV